LDNYHYIHTTIKNHHGRTFNSNPKTNVGLNKFTCLQGR